MHLVLVITPRIPKSHSNEGTKLIEAGRIAPIIDRSYPLAEVPEALRYLESGNARGKVVITV